MYGLLGERYLGDVGHREQFRQLVHFLGKIVRKLIGEFKLFKSDKFIFKQLVKLDKHFKHFRLDKFNYLIKQCRKLVNRERFGAAEQFAGTKQLSTAKQCLSKLVKHSAARGRR